MSDSHAGSGRSSAAATTTVDAQVFIRRYLAHAGTQLPGRSREDLLELARDALSFGLSRSGDDALLRLVDRDGQTTAVDVVSRDAPYIVESLSAELSRSGYPLENLLHPQIVAMR